MGTASNRKQSIKVDENVAMETRDGTVLRADIYRPSDGGQYPVLLCRTPYDKLLPSYIESARDLASRGYTVVVQDIRGRHASDGEFFWQFRDNDETCDAEDGYDAVEWVASLPYSDGQVGTWGNSYASWCIWRLAAMRPPHLKALYASGMSARLLDLNFGVFETGRRLQWTYMMAADARRRAGSGSGPRDRFDADAEWLNVQRGKWVWQLPFEDIPDYVFSTLTPQLKKYYREQNLEFWDFDAIHKDVNVPTFQSTGWWDRLVGTVDQFAGMVENGPASLRNSHKIIIGPWGHSASDLRGDLGPVEYGPGARTTYEDLIARWYDCRFKGIENGIDSEPPVHLFVLNENKWHFEHEWPLARTQYTPFFLHSKGRANTVHGDGTLSTTEPSGETPDEYDYDPRDPVMSLMNLNSQAAPVDQAPNDGRQDILVYQTPPLEQDVRVIGPVSLTLWASSSAPETDFTAKLIDVQPDGVAVNLTYGIMRTSYRDGYGNPTPIEPGRPYEYNVKLNPAGVLFRRGHRIRLDVASSDFPNFDRNHNTGKDFWSDTELRVAHQTVFHDREHPSRLTLPLIPE